MPEILNQTQTDEIIPYLNSLYAQNDWKKILKINFKTPSVLWAWPTEKSLEELGRILKKYDLNGVTSIGCGSGLLECLIETSTNCKVYSIDLIDSWWAKNPKAPNFGEKIWIDLKLNIDFSKILNEKTALMFCYFNNQNAFLNYIKNFKGNFVIIVGPKPNFGRHTAPCPLNPSFEKDKIWEMKEIFDFNENGDVATIWMTSSEKEEIFNNEQN